MIVIGKDSPFMKQMNWKALFENDNDADIVEFHVNLTTFVGATIIESG